MIEIAELDYCVSFGLTVKEAKQGLEEALYQWIRKHGINRLPEVKAAAQIFFFIEKEMEQKEFDWINEELKKLEI